MINTCKACGLCCKLFLINLNEKEYRSGIYETAFKDFGTIEDFKQAVNCGANILAQKKDGSCIYLKGKLCSIHKIRPAVCRKFFCTSKDKKFEGMIKTVNQAIDK